MTDVIKIITLGLWTAFLAMILLATSKIVNDDKILEASRWGALIMVAPLVYDLNRRFPHKN